MATARERLREQAEGRFGYVTAGDARELGLAPVELGKLHARGALQKVTRGLYRFPDLPAGQHDQFAEAVLLAGRDAYLTHDAVLALHGLGQVNPRRIRVGTPHRVRAGLPGYVEVIRRKLPEDALTVYEGIPSATVAQAVVDCHGLVMPMRLRAAVLDATAVRLLTPSEANAVRAKLRRLDREARR